MNVINVCFQHHKQAPYFFKDLSFALDKGLIHALHGKNGVGKSVFLNVLYGNMDPEAIVGGEIISEKIELMNQQFDQALVGQFTFIENIQFGSLGRFPSPFFRLKALSNVLTDDYLALIETFHINVKLPVNKLSGGQRQILTLLTQVHHSSEKFTLFSSYK
ncbi:MAG: ATP-binding cassette domain-containing protein [Parachlamydiaceae bacterium]|nr:ATP-binding cassette domain-containing protein [Parachlamydiaceae bacterium]